MNIPILTTFFKLTQHQAHGTTLAATMATAVVGSISFYKNGGGLRSVDVPAAIIMSGVAMSVVPFAARWAQKLSQRKLLIILSGLQTSVIPLLALGAGNRKACAESAAEAEPVEEKEPCTQGSFAFQSWKNLAILAGIGVATGFGSGVFGIGGGLAMVPLFSLVSGSHQLSIGTSLCGMLGPSSVSLLSHWKLGNIFKPIALPLFIGSGLGAYMGSVSAISMTESQQISIFSALMAVLVARNIQVIRSLPR